MRHNATGRRGAWMRMREATPVVLVNGRHVLTRRDDVIAAGTDPDRFATLRQAVFSEMGLPMVPLVCAAPDHTRYRQVLQPLLTPRMLGEMPLRQQATALIDAVCEQGECDFVRDIAVPYPAQVLLMLLGLSQEHRDRLIALTDAADRVGPYRLYPPGQVRLDDDLFAARTPATEVPRTPTPRGCIRLVARQTPRLSTRDRQTTPPAAFMEGTRAPDLCGIRHL
jgi:cytochrome P450